MRVGWLLVLALSLGVGVPSRAQAPAPPPPGQADAAAGVLAAARSALGGDGKLAGVRTFEARGRTRQVRGNNLVPIEFEIWCELPDKFARRDEIPAQESGPTTNGFAGDTLIQWPPPAAPAAKPPATPSDPGAARVASARQDFVRLTLGMFSASFPSYPLTFSLAGQAEAPQGTADVLDVKGPGTFRLKLFIGHETHLPVMVSWTTPATSVVIVEEGEPQPENIAPGTIVVKAPPLPAPTAAKEEREQYAALIQDLRKKTLAAAKPVEHRLYYADYRDIGTGIRFPFRLRRATAGQTLEETNFDEFKTNVRIDPRRFAPAK